MKILKNEGLFQRIGALGKFIYCVFWGDFCGNFFSSGTRSGECRGWFWHWARLAGAGKHLLSIEQNIPEHLPKKMGFAVGNKIIYNLWISCWCDIIFSLKINEIVGIGLDFLKLYSYPIILTLFSAILVEVLASGLRKLKFWAWLLSLCFFFYQLTFAILKEFYTIPVPSLSLVYVPFCIIGLWGLLDVGSLKTLKIVKEEKQSI